MITDDLRQRRLAVIREHMDTEVTKEFDATLATFNGHPHYEIMATGQVFDGDEEVMGYYLTTRTAFPDQRHDNARFHVSDDAVIVEFDLLGTNLGEFYGMPPTGKSFRVPIIAVFFFDGDRIINERIYFDTASLVTQIGRGELLALAGMAMPESTSPLPGQRRIEADDGWSRRRGTYRRVGPRQSPWPIWASARDTAAAWSASFRLQGRADAAAGRHRHQSVSRRDGRGGPIGFAARPVAPIGRLLLPRGLRSSAGQSRARLVLWADAVAGPSEDVRPQMVSADRGGVSREEIEKRIALAVSARDIARPVDAHGLATVVVAMLRGVALQRVLDDQVDLGAARREVEQLLAARLGVSLS